MVIAEQAPMFMLPERPDAPRCRMCARPAWWSPNHQRYSMYCTSKGCHNQQRLCQICGAEFTVKVDGAGTKYCSTRCKDEGYHPTRKNLPRCAWCGTRANGYISTRGVWPYICRPCLEPIWHVVHRLKQHRVKPEMARRLLTDHGCEVCGTDLLEKRVQPGERKPRAGLVVDHDHTCCPGSNSCGECVRGFLCVQCNSAAGMLRDSADVARALADYLDRIS